MSAPGTNPGLPRRVDAPNGVPIRRETAPPGDGSAASSAAFEIASIPARAPRTLRRFLRETRAAVGITAAAVSIMVLGGVALIGDHLWMVGKRDLLQRAADAAAIAATFELRERPTSESDTEVEAALKPVAERYARFNVLGNTAGDLDPEDIEVTLDVDRNAGTVGVSVTADVGDTLFAKMLYGYEGPGEVTTRAGAERDTTKAEVVLAMDVTTSMEDNLAGEWPGLDHPTSRMNIVRQAADVLVDILDPGNQESMVAIGVVPWHINVRLSETMRADWERKRWAVYPDEKTYPRPYSADAQVSPETWRMPAKPEEWQGCLDQRALRGSPAPGLSAALPSDSAFTMAFFPVLGSTSYQCRDLSGDSFGSFWQDCYHGPTPGEFAQRDTEIPCPPSIGSCTHYRMAPQQLCERGNFILPLSRDMDEVRRTIKALTPVGNMTYSTMGLIWGRRLLTPEWRQPVWGDEVHPVDPDGEDALGVRKAIVLLTDGEDNYGSALGAAPDRSEACTAAKDAGIEIFVVAAMNPAGMGSVLETGLTNCSSKDDYPDRTYVFLENHTKEDLEDAFRQIANQLLVVRRTH